MTAHSLDLKGQVALVTGANRGLGRTLVDRLAGAGAAVAVVGRDGEACARVTAELIEEGHQATAVQADLHDSGQIADAVRQTVTSLGRLDILVNNAGAYPHSALLELPDDEWDDVMAVNLRGAFLAIRESARQMIEQGEGGRIVSIASVDAVAPEPRFSHYDASKGGLVALTRSLALELGEHGITINAVGPGLIDSPDLERHVPKRRAAFLEHVPLGTIGSADDIADCVLFLASGMAGWITGQTIYVDGGVTLAGYMWGVDE